MVPNAGNVKAVAAALAERAAGFDVVVEDVSDATSLIAVQGPNAVAILLTPRPGRTAPAGSRNSSTTPPSRSKTAVAK